MNIPPLPLGVPALPAHAECATLDMETYSVAGYRWDPDKRTWLGPEGSNSKGLGAVGSRKYAEHPSTEVLTFSYRLPNGVKGRWVPGHPCPPALAAHIARGGLIEAHNAMFERNLWTFVLVPKHGFPPINPAQWRCSMSKARAAGYPGALAQLGAAMRLNVQKDKRGGDLIKLFSMPRKPTKADPSLRVLPEHDPDAFEAFQVYCDTDVATEHEASSKLPELIPSELAYWQADQAVNFRGLGVDLPHVEAACQIVNQTLERFGEECERLTGGIGPSKVQALAGWCTAMGVPMESLDAESLETALKRTDLPPVVRRVLEIRQLTGSASVKKVFAMRSFCSDAGRCHDMHNFHGARTGRDTHSDLQPGNLPKAGPKLWHCLAPLCNRWYGAHLTICPWCSSTQREGLGAGEGKKGDPNKPEAWCFHGVQDALEAVATASAAAVQYVFGDALLTVSGVVRSLIVSAPGHDLVCSDYSSIEAVVIAVLAGEEWRVEAFKRKEDMYLHGAAGVTGMTYLEYQAWAEENGRKHPDRNKYGKPAELGLGFGGWIGALFAFGFDGTEAEAREIVQKWRAASPMIVELWGGQFRGTPWAPTSTEYYGLEGMAVQAVLNPGQRFTYRLISFEVDPAADVLYMILPSGRRISYREPRLTHGSKRDGWAATYELTFMTHNSNPKMGPLGWVRMPTYGGRLAENATQAVARDIMANAVVNLEQGGYPVVLRVHDEIASEVPEGFGSVEEFEATMQDLPAWAKGWPIRAAGGWRGKRYRKD